MRFCNEGLKHKNFSSHPAPNPPPPLPPPPLAPLLPAPPGAQVQVQVTRFQVQVTRFPGAGAGNRPLIFPSDGEEQLLVITVLIFPSHGLEALVNLNVFSST